MIEVELSDCSCSEILPNLRDPSRCAQHGPPLHRMDQQHFHATGGFALTYDPISSSSQDAPPKQRAALQIPGLKVVPHRGPVILLTSSPSDQSYRLHRVVDR